MQLSSYDFDTDKWIVHKDDEARSDACALDTKRGQLVVLQGSPIQLLR